jgi:hypothetical protein
MRGETMVAGPTYHRHVLEPGDDVTGQDERVIAIATAVWTKQLIAARARKG